MKAPRQKAFSLIEILTVVVILAVLAAAMIPIIRQANEASKSVKTVSNMRSILSAMRMEAAENQGWITLRGPVWRWDFYNAHLHRKGYLPMEAFSDSWVEPKHDDRWRRDEENRFSAYGYGIRFLNAWQNFYQTLRGANGPILNSSEMWGSWPIQLNPTLIENPANFWLLGDSLELAERRQKIYMTGDPQDPWIGRFHLRHRGKAHAAFLDGHVELCDKKRLKDIGIRTVINAEGVEESL